MKRGQGWLLDASVAFVLVLVLSQLCLLWLSIVVDAGNGGVADKQARLIAASDRLIHDPSCLAAADKNGVVPQEIVMRELGEKRLAYCCDGCGYGIGVGHKGAVVRRLVLVGGEPSVLSVW